MRPRSLLYYGGLEFVQGGVTNAIPFGYVGLMEVPVEPLFNGMIMADQKVMQLIQLFPFMLAVPNQ